MLKSLKSAKADLFVLIKISPPKLHGAPSEQGQILSLGRAFCSGFAPFSSNHGQQTVSASFSSNWQFGV